MRRTKDWETFAMKRVQLSLSREELSILAAFQRRLSKSGKRLSKSSILRALFRAAMGRKEFLKLIKTLQGQHK